MMHCPETFPVPLVHLSETDSTNRYLKQLCDQSTVEELTTIVAEFQTSGRGQRGNTWESEAGKNLMFSFVLYPTFLEARRQFLLSQLISLAIKEELDQYADGFSIKWPNDIYWHNRKIAGILIENNLIGSSISRSIVGVGLNINQTDFHSDAPNPVSLGQITGKEHECLVILAQIIRRFKESYTSIGSNHAQTIGSRYQQALFRSTGMHRYKDTNGEFLATISHIESDGILVLHDEQGKERRYAFKEVQYLL